MTASISVLPVIRVEHAHEAALCEADDLSHVVKLDDYQRRKEPRATEYSLPEGYGQLSQALALLWLRNLEIAAKFSTVPLWPGGIDDLKW
jgi:hypothetical protein